MTWSSILSRPEGTMSLRPVQERALSEALQAGGLLGHLGVGSGKTLLAALLPSVLRCERPVLVIPPALRAQTAKMRAIYAAHWYLMPTTVITYTDISTKPGLLAEIAPDLLILDEGHHASLVTAARTRRIGRYLRKSACKVVVLSGTLVDHRISRWYHLARWTVGDASPAPQHHKEAVELQRVLTGEGSAQEQIRWSRKVLGYEPSDWGARWAEHVGRVPGIVLDSTLSCGASLLWHWLPSVETDTITEALTALDATWELPDRVWADAPAISQAKAMLRWGVYYRWDEAPDPRWLEARRVWASAVRQYTPHAAEGRDTEMLIRNACDAGRAPTPYLREAWLKWAPFSSWPKPKTVPVWLDQRPLRTLVESLEGQPPTLIWCAYSAIGEMLERLGVRRAELGAVPEYRGDHVVVSIQGHGTGAELQAWSRSVVLSAPPSALRWEQMIGRTHRQGQLADEVEVCAYEHDREIVARAHAEAVVARGVLGEQRLCLALGEAGE